MKGPCSASCPGCGLFLTRIEPAQGPSGLYQVGGCGHKVPTINHKKCVVRQSLLHLL